jgi:CBS domain containing-hemolysin-like protein
MTIFVLSVLLVLSVSAVCSLTEAALYSVRLPYIRRLEESGNRAGRILKRFKDNMERPISAILIVNTAANTAGAAVAGAQASQLFGESVIMVFSASFTLAVLFLSEIVPKILGVVHSRTVARTLAVPLDTVVWMVRPMIWVVEWVSVHLKPKGPFMVAPEDEVRQFAMMSADEGSILRFEAELVKNVLQLDEVSAKEIMTPRPVVQKLTSNLNVREAAKTVQEWTYSRIPIVDAEDPERWIGVVFSRDILAALAEDRFEVTLGELAGPLDFVPETTQAHVLLKGFLKNRRHLAGVVDEYGSVLGLVTLEDVLESVIGEEIVDEVDQTDDLQALAKRRRRGQIKKELQRAGEAAPVTQVSDREKER